MGRRPRARTAAAQQLTTAVAKPLRGAASCVSTPASAARRDRRAQEQTVTALPATTPRTGLARPSSLRPAGDPQLVAAGEKEHCRVV
jgi:hypothetical protein